MHGLRTLGVRPGGILLVHSSLSALGYVPGGVRAVISTLSELIGAEGTLVMPAHSWQAMEEGCRTFDVRLTPSCVGAITEGFRKMPGVVRSLHPTHSVAAFGPRANWLVEGHELASTPCGAGTPYAKALDQDSQILFLGIGLDYNTAFHTLESLAGLSYLLRESPEVFTITEQSGASRQMPFVRHQAGIRRRYGALEGLLADVGVLHRGCVSRSSCLLLSGRAFQEYLLPKLRQDSALFLAENAGNREGNPMAFQKEALCGPSCSEGG